MSYFSYQLDLVIPGILPSDAKSLSAILDIFNFLYTPCGLPETSQRFLILAFAEFFRILRPGGRLIVLEFSKPKNPVVSFFNGVYTKRIMPITATCISRDQSGAYKYLPKSVETFTEPAELANQISQAGFADIEQKSLTFGVCTITKAIKR